MADTSQSDAFLGLGLSAAPETWFSVQCPRSCCETDLSAKHIPFAESLAEEYMPARSIRLSEDSIAHIRSHDATTE